MAKLTGKTSPCPQCRANGRDRSGDNLHHYSDLSAHCFACGYDEQPNKQHTQEEDLDMATMEDVASLPCKALPLRRISEAVAARYGVRCEANVETGEAVAFYAPLYNAKGLCGYQRKVARKPGLRQKGDVSRVGESKGCLPFGSHVTGHKGSFLIVTEGYEDCLAAVELLAAKGKDYRVVATLGTDGWKNNLEWWAGWQKIVIAYDQDDAGRDAAEEFAKALAPGQAAIARWDESIASDPNALLGRVSGPDRWLDAINKARVYSPSGIIYGEEVWERMENYTAPQSVSYPPEWELMNQKLVGMREAEISMWCAGSSIGKTSMLRRIKQHIVTSTPWRVGEVELEERIEKTARGMMQFQLGKRWTDAAPEEKRLAYEATYGSGKLFILDRGLRNKKDGMLAQFKHMHYHHGVNIIFLDHVTLGVSDFGGKGDGSLNDTDSMMESILHFVEETKCHVCLVSHLRKPPSDGKSWSKGAVPTYESMKGSGSLFQISFDIVGVSRNLLHSDEYEQNVSQLTVLKSRETGRTGPADRLYYDSISGTLSPATNEQPNEEEANAF